MCTPIRSRLSTKSLTSPPAQKARPAPVMTMQRTDGSSSTSSTACMRSRPSPRLSALKASGRLRVIVATASWRARVRNLKSMEVLSGLSIGSPRTAGPQPRDVLRLALRASLGALAGRARHRVQDVGDLQRLDQHHVHSVRLALLGRQLDAEAGDE